MSRRRRQVMTTPHTPGHHEGGTQHPHVRQGRREASVEVGCGMLPGGAAHVANARRRSSCGEGRGVVLGMPAVCVGTWPACENGGPDVRWEVDGGAGIVRARLRPGPIAVGRRERASWPGTHVRDAVWTTCGARSRAGWRARATRVPVRAARAAGDPIASRVRQIPRPGVKK